MGWKHAAGFGEILAEPSGDCLGMLPKEFSPIILVIELFIENLHIAMELALH